MFWLRGLKQLAKSVRDRLRSRADALTRIAGSGYFRAEDIAWICETYFTQGVGPGTPWQRALRDAHMRLPDWFRQGLDPYGEAYSEQQRRLWQLVAGVDRAYEAEVDEREHHWGDVDPVRSPGYFLRRDPLAVEAASDHVLATGMMLKHCGLAPGDWALEYGAGFGQTALALARLGVNVDTVDISATFCDFVRRQAEFFQVPLTPFHGHFGFNPRGAHKYKVIWFYESFHHCIDFLQVVKQLREHLAEGGRVILGGEPIVEREYAAVPYPWGLRLHSEVTAVVRRQSWFELGFSEDFLFDMFTRAGFVGHRIECEPSLFGRLYVFERRPDVVEFAKQWLPPVLGEQWHPPHPDGRWSRGSATWPLDTSAGFSAIEVELANPTLRRQQVRVRYADAQQRVELASGEVRSLRFDAGGKAPLLELQCQALQPSWIDRFRAGDRLAFGVFARHLRYVQ
jgi:SAM-dependent methyltransferase